MGDNSTGPETMIILTRDQAAFYEFLKPRQEARRGTIVILDRREGERRTDGQQPSDVERRKQQRRVPTPEAAMALMSVLGFMILHHEEGRWVP